MKKFYLVGTGLFLLVQLSSATTCTSGSLSSYISLGSAGCSIGSDTLSNFAILPGITGVTELGGGSVQISVSGGSFTPSLTFSTNQTVSAGEVLESIFTYDISGASFTSSAISLSGASETVDGGVTEIENYCAGGTFGPDGVSGCSGTGGTLLNLDGVQNTDQSTLGPVTSLQITNDFTLNSGTAGTASGGVFTNSFTSVTTTPEPASLLCAGLGLACLGLFRGRKR
jgi:hypothetical protein